MGDLLYKFLQMHIVTEELLQHLLTHVYCVQNYGMDWDERVLPSIGSEVVKAVVAQYNAEQLLTQREKV